MVDQEYELQVFPSYAYEGNTAVLKCLMPPFVSLFLVVDAWIEGNEFIRSNVREGEEAHQYEVERS